LRIVFVLTFLHYNYCYCVEVKLPQIRPNIAPNPGSSSSRPYPPQNNSQKRVPRVIPANVRQPRLEIYIPLFYKEEALRSVPGFGGTDDEESLSDESMIEGSTYEESDAEEPPQENYVLYFIVSISR
jgi:hypothetical protein